MKNSDSNSRNLLDAAYKCKPTELESLLKEIENAIKNSEYPDSSLLRAKTVVTSKLALKVSFK
ncbi:hypothetical protein [Methanobacterium sp. ACI-7]|uniref:hypothetical protein n=1 Tax=unclassified Methanobacterium TaxID=2627676 RepID=UPI0039C1CD3A